MDIAKMIKKIMIDEDINISQLATLLETGQPNISKKLARNDFKISDLEKILSILGYDLKIEFIKKV